MAERPKESSVPKTKSEQKTDPDPPDTDDGEHIAPEQKSPSDDADGQVDLDGETIDPTVTTEKTATARIELETDHLRFSTTVRQVHKAKQKDAMAERDKALKKKLGLKTDAVMKDAPGEDRLDEEWNEILSWLLTWDTPDPDKLESRIARLY